MPCRPARPADLPGIHALLAGLRAFPGATDARAVELRLWAVWKQTGWSPLNQVVAVEGDRVLGSICFFPAGERGAAVEPPRHLKEVDGAAFVREALDALRGRFAYVQAVLEEESAVLRDGGMPVVSTLLMLEREAGPEDAGIAPEAGLVWLPYSGTEPARFEETIRRTLEGSKDVPAVQGALPASEMLAAYRPKGKEVPARWWLAEAGGEAVGCLLLNAEGETLELKYMGVVPEERGKRLGRALVRKAIQEGRGFKRIAVTVDEANGAAKAIYLAHGFRVAGRKRLHFAML